MACLFSIEIGSFSWDFVDARAFPKHLSVLSVSSLVQMHFGILKLDHFLGHRVCRAHEPGACAALSLSKATRRTLSLPGGHRSGYDLKIGKKYPLARAGLRFRRRIHHENCFVPFWLFCSWALQKQNVSHVSRPHRKNHDVDRIRQVFGLQETPYVQQESVSGTVNRGHDHCSV